MKITFKDALPVLLPVLIIGGLAYGALFAPKAPELGYAPVEFTGSDIVVLAQPNDTQAVMSKVVAKTPSFVTVHESMSGAPAEIIGTSAILPVGEYQNIAVPLNRETLPGYRYIVLLMADTNANGVFDAGVDLPIMSEGAVIKRDFIAGEDPDKAAEKN